MIRIGNLNKYFNKGRDNEIHVINDMSFELPEKGMVALFGKSGCGKTTLLNVLGGLDGFSSGTVEIDGRNIKNGTDDIRNRYIGYIFQNYNLDKSVSIARNVGDALRLCGMTDNAEIEKRTDAALACVGMEHFRSRTPDTLSGGQQQRVAIARAIVKNPKIILADEPTGNLDEENTVMIMDLLRRIANDHLVVLVTHEENLVDYYCDRVIRLSDGSIAEVRDNTSASGYVAKNKNDIYLGELESKRGTAAGADVCFYGPEPEEPIKLRIINRGGELLLKIDTPKVRILDETSEIRLREGVFEAEKKVSGVREIDMSALPPVECGKTGRLFGLGSSIKSGFLSNFTGNRAGKKALLSVLAVFAVVMVFLTATFGTTIKELIDIESSYNHNVAYMNIPNEETYLKLKALTENPESGIDSMTISYTMSRGYESLSFSPGSFESYRPFYGSADIEATGVFLPLRLTDGLKKVAGKISGLMSNEIVITSAVASKMLENASYSYIATMSDLIGLTSRNRYDDRSSFRIAGIVDSSDPAFYMDEVALADKILENYGGPLVQRASIFGVTDLTPGETVVITSGYGSGYYDGDVDSETSRRKIAEGDVLTVSGGKYKAVLVCSLEELSEKYPQADERRVWPKSDPVCLVCDEDYVKIAFSAEKTDDDLITLPKYYSYGEDDALVIRFAVIHSSNIAKTASMLKEIAPAGIPDGYGLRLPADIRNVLVSDNMASIVSHIISLAVFTAVMCLCMYFIMRSTMMTRVREIGIYRAIGVTKRNILFRFLIETAVLTTFTVFAAFLISSVAAGYLGSVGSMKSVIFYPGWIAVILAVFMYTVCLICGIAPVASLLRKTPSEILAKYDI